MMCLNYNYICILLILDEILPERFGIIYYNTEHNVSPISNVT